MKRVILFLCILLAQQWWLAESSGEGSLYDVLGVSRHANQKEIRNAYKRLAKEWHPDKNKSPEAQERIMEINKAYEVLSDEDARQRYDMTGETGNASPQFQGHTHHPGFTVFQSGNGFFRFNFGGWGQGHQRKDTMTTHYFLNTVVPESSHRVFLLNFYTDFCMQCGDVERVWEELREEMVSQNIGMGSVHAFHHGQISQYCRVDRVPAIVAVVNQRAIHYHGNLQARSIRNFVKGVIPSWVVTELSATILDTFLEAAIPRNKPRVVLLSPHAQPSLLYKSTAFSNQDSVDFAFISTDTGSGHSLTFLQQFGVSWREKKLLLYKEYPSPAVEVEGHTLDRATLKSVVEGVRLHLPRLSSPHLMNTLCETGGRICVVLVVSGTKAYNGSVTAAFRELAVQVARERRLGHSLVYIDGERQREFVAVFGGSGEMRRCPSGERARPVILLKRQSNQFALYDWYSKFCGVSGDGEDLLSYTSTVSMAQRVMLPDLGDEFAPGVLGQLWKKAVQGWYDVYDYFWAVDSQALTLLFTVLAMAVLMCCLSIIGVSQNMEEEGRGQRRRRAHRQDPREQLLNHQQPNPQSKVNTPRIPSLTEELYQKYIEHGPKGVVAIVLFTGSQNTAEIVRTFAEVIRRHHSSRMRSFRASHAIHCHWLKEVLRVSNMEFTERGKRNKVHFEDLFAVLGLFGARKQFVIFPELGESAGETLRGPSCNGWGRTTEHEAGSEWSHIAAMALNSLGFEEEDNDNESTHHSQKQKLLEGRNSGQEEETGNLHRTVHAQTPPTDSTNISDAGSSGEVEGVNVGGRGVGVGYGDHVRRLREGLGVWLERLEDGSLNRYSVDYWPELTGTETTYSGE